MKRSSFPAAEEESPSFSLPPPPPPSNHKKKKTRDLPNLSDCHGCNRRINCTNPKNRLRILSSEWRIVLLCKSCYNLVESSQYCSYCLSRVSSSLVESFFECKRCRRRIHRDCVSKFSAVCDFDACFDCWIPDLLEKEYIKACHGRVKKKVKTCGDLASLGSTRVCDNGSQSKDKSMEVMVSEADVLARKNVELADEVKEKVATKGMVARRAVEIATGALDFVAADKSGDQESLVVEDDAQLAIRLHRAMNSSPRISRSSCLLNTNSTNVHMVGRSPNVGVGKHADDIENGNVTCEELSELCLAHTRQDCVERINGMQDEKSNGESNGLITYTRKMHASLDGSLKEKADKCLLKMYTRKPLRVERNSAVCGHYSKTYSRRPSATSHCKNKLQCGDFGFQRGVLAFSIALNCCEESRASTDNIS